MAKDIIETLFELKEQLEKAKSEVAKAEGVFEQLAKQLKEKYDVGSIKEADELLKKMEKDLDRIDDDIKEQEQKLEGYLQ